MGNLRQHIFGGKGQPKCTHPACAATRELEERGGNLTLGKGRHCELAALAAAGPAGIADHELVEARRAYAKHLGVQLSGLTTGAVANADRAIHARWAAEGNVVGNPLAKHAIPLGRAKVHRSRHPRTETQDHYYLTWLG